MEIEDVERQINARKHAADTEADAVSRTQQRVAQLEKEVLFEVKSFENKRNKVQNDLMVALTHITDFKSFMEVRQWKGNFTKQVFMSHFFVVLLYTNH